jgi:SAM-dependent methyltransferase
MLSAGDLTSRVERVYSPKLDWVIEAVGRHGLSRKALARKSWLEIGCGAGYFLRALETAGFTQAEGIDFSPELVEQANIHNSSIRATQSVDMLGDLERSSADIVAAFFVLEHLEDVRQFWEVMSDKPAGTFLAISVPTLGMTTLFENAFPEIPARNLDWEVHNQLYTDKSLSFSLEKSGFASISEWFFGQDAQDLISHVLAKLNWNGGWVESFEELASIDDLVDPIQRVIDRAHLCDARHVLAVKR